MAEPATIRWDILWEAWLHLPWHTQLVFIVIAVIATINLLCGKPRRQRD